MTQQENIKVVKRRPGRPSKYNEDTAFLSLVVPRSLKKELEDEAHNRSYSLSEWVAANIMARDSEVAGNILEKLTRLNEDMKHLVRTNSKQQEIIERMERKTSRIVNFVEEIEPDPIICKIVAERLETLNNRIKRSEELHRETKEVGRSTAGIASREEIINKEVDAVCELAANHYLAEGKRVTKPNVLKDSVRIEVLKKMREE